MGAHVISASSPLRKPHQTIENAAHQELKSFSEGVSSQVSLLLPLSTDASGGKTVAPCCRTCSSAYQHTHLSVARYSEKGLTGLPAAVATSAAISAASSGAASLGTAGADACSAFAGYGAAGSAAAAAAAAHLSLKYFPVHPSPSCTKAAIFAASRVALLLPAAAAGTRPGAFATIAKLPPVRFASCTEPARPQPTLGTVSAAARQLSARTGGCCSLAFHQRQQARQQDVGQLRCFTPKTDVHTGINNCVLLSESPKQRQTTPGQLQRSWPLPQKQEHLVAHLQQQLRLTQQHLLLRQQLRAQQHLFQCPVQRHQEYQQEFQRPFSSGFPNTKKRITNPFWRRTGWWDWRRREVGKLNKARARRRHLWPRASSPWRAPSGAVGGVPAADAAPAAAVAAARAAAAAAARGYSGVKRGESAAAVAAARAAAAADAAAAAVARCTQKKPPSQDDSSNSSSRRRLVVLPVEGARQRPFWRQSRQKLLKQHRQAVSAAEAAARSAAAEEEQETEEDFGPRGGEEDNGSAGPYGAQRQGRRMSRLRLTQQDLMGVKKGRGRVWEERKDGIPLGKKRLLLYCRLIKGAQITDAIDWLSALCIHRVNYLLNLLIKTRQKIHEEGGDVSRVFVESYMLNIQGRVKRLQFRLRMVNFIKTWKFAVIIRCRELPLDEFFHRLFILKKVPRSLTTDMRLAIVEKRVAPAVIRDWYPYLDATTRFWHRHRLRWLDRTRQFDYYVARKAFKATYEENCRRRRVQLLEARGAPARLIENEKLS